MNTNCGLCPLTSRKDGRATMHRRAQPYLQHVLPRARWPGPPPIQSEGAAEETPSRRFRGEFPERCASSRCTFHRPLALMRRALQGPQLQPRSLPVPRDPRSSPKSPATRSVHSARPPRPLTSPRLFPFPDLAPRLPFPRSGSVRARLCIPSRQFSTAPADKEASKRDALTPEEVKKQWWTAVKLGNVEEMGDLTDRADVDTTDEADRRTALHVAAMKVCLCSCSNRS